ncbi:hypothetical protein AN641_01300 [Candidatus Epulonipiscioides gigas]|nr:hypothetical protein AN641_01300 [Epulopiscium sp. SCG-C07WGA-EpuloA2]
MKENYKGIVLFLLLITFATMFIFYNKIDPEVVFTEHDKKIESIATKVREIKDESSATSEEINLLNHEPIEIYIHIDGEVQMPDVYKIEEGKIIDDLIKMAGGLTDNADLTTINLAEKISPNTKIFIPKKGENLAVEANHMFEENIDSKDSRININTATVAEFDSLPGIGAVRASAIIAYRQEFGSFNDIQELTNISGIGDATLSNIKDLIKIK